MRLSGILGTIGRTPLIKLERISELYAFNVYAKLEFFNPSGSLKDRAAYNVIKTAILERKINHETTIVECSSGNFALGLAMICKYLNISFICVVDPRVTQQYITLLKTYDVTIIVVTDPDPISGEFLPELMRKVRVLLDDIPNSFWPNQHGNLNNALAHYSTMQEIMTQLNGKVDYLFCATSSCGTLRGCHDFIRKNNLRIKIFAVDAEGSKIFSKAKKNRIIPGHGAGILPELYHEKINCEPVIISAEKSIFGCRQLFEKEAILTGGSSGALISALDYVKEKIEMSANCVIILCDRGERYLDTIYSDSWVRKHFDILG